MKCYKDGSTCESKATCKPCMGTYIALALLAVIAFSKVLTGA